MDAKDVLRTTMVVIDALDTLQMVARTYTDRPDDALQTIDVMIESLRDGLAGRTTPDVLAAEVRALLEQIANEHPTRPTLDSKFDPGGTDP